MTGRLRIAALLALVLAVAILASATTPDQLIDNGRYKQARAMLSQQLGANPNDAHLNWLSARVHRAFGDLPGAISLAQKAVQLDPRKADYHLTLAELLGRQAQQSSILKQLGLVRTIRKELDTAYQLEPRNVDAQWGMLKFYWMAPAIAGGDKSKARAIANDIAKLDAVQGWFAQASFAADEKRQGDAENAYRKAVEADPRSYDARISLAEFYMAPASKKLAQAEEQLRAAVKIAPGRIDAYNDLADIYAQTGQMQKLEAVLADSERQIGDNLLPYCTAAQGLIDSGKEFATAERYLRKYLTQEAEGNATPLNVAHWRLSQVLEKQGRTPEAIAELHTSVQLNPYFEPAKKDLKRLHG